MSASAATAMIYSFGLFVISATLWVAHKSTQQTLSALTEAIKALAIAVSVLTEVKEK